MAVHDKLKTTCDKWAKQKILTDNNQNCVKVQTTSEREGDKEREREREEEK